MEAEREGLRGNAGLFPGDQEELQGEEEGPKRAVEQLHQQVQEFLSCSRSRRSKAAVAQRSLPQVEQLQARLQAAGHQRTRLEEDLQRSKGMVSGEGRARPECSRSGLDPPPSPAVLQAAEAQSLGHRLQLQLQQQEQRLAERERLNQEKEAQLEQQVRQQGFCRGLTPTSGFRLGRRAAVVLFRTSRLGGIWRRSSRRRRKRWQSR